MANSIFGGIEAGGTRFNCVIGSGPTDIRIKTSFPTTTPIETIERAIAFFTSNQQPEPLLAVGIGSFGPIDLNPVSETFGYITSTPKTGWSHTEFAGKIKRAVGVPVAFDTDTNAAALAEATWGAARGLHTFVYLTIGTGIGGAAMVNSRLLHGLSHPEMGHLKVPHNLATDPYKGVCPFHGDCLEGLASGPAVQARWGEVGEKLPAQHPAWLLEAQYLGLGLTDIIYAFSPQRIILGGGVMKQQAILPIVRREVLRYLNGYPELPSIERGIDSYIVAPGLGSEAGMLGALALAKEIVE